MSTKIERSTWSPPAWTTRSPSCWVNNMPACHRLVVGCLSAFGVAFAVAAQAPASDSSQQKVTVAVIAKGLDVPWSLAFAPDGRLFVTERVGRIRNIANGSLQDEPWTSLQVFATGEGGLMGLDIDPNFVQNNRVYVCYSGLRADFAATNRIAVLSEENGTVSAPHILIDDIPAATDHDGCRLGFGPDGKLYATTGDADRPGLAQALDSLAGKVLRLNTDGSIPADNPFPNSYVWSYGHRNAQGLAWDPAGRLYLTEHGTGGLGNNELNIIERGKNYGWPTVIGPAHDPRFVDPILIRADAPAGATIVTSNRYGDWRGSLLI